MTDEPTAPMTREEAISLLEHENAGGPEWCRAYNMAIAALRREGELLEVLQQVQEQNRKKCFIPESDAYKVACEVTRILGKYQQPPQEHAADE